MTELWAVHVEGPDDMLAMPDRSFAESYAQTINALYERFTQRPDHDAYLDPRWHGVVVPWPYSAESHAESLTEQAEENVPEYPFTDEGLARALADLGDSKDAVADTLTRGGWRGLRDECQACPVAVYLKAKFGRFVLADVGPYAVSVTRDFWVDEGHGLGGTETQCIAAEMPAQIEDFIFDFDHQIRYSHLEAA
jgi:hypothetical protein